MKSKLVFFAFFLAYFSLKANANWQCRVEDAKGKTWSNGNFYQKVAMNTAYDRCKKESTVPQSCKQDPSFCLDLNTGTHALALWTCTALDSKGASWNSIEYSNMDDAALGAKDFCKSKSSLPESCYVNLIACKNNNQEQP